MMTKMKLLLRSILVVPSMGGGRGSPVPPRLASASAARGLSCHTRSGLQEEGSPLRGSDIGAVADSAG